MSLTGAMFTAANGMQAHTEAMNAVADNISNVNTIGFKESRSRFSDVIGSVPGGTSSLAEAGQGTVLSGVDANFAQGTLQTTGRATHLALQGTGFFIVRGNHAGIDGSYYTRDGSFRMTKDGTLETQNGQVLQGYLADDLGNLSPGVEDLALPLKQLAEPFATANITMQGNLNAQDNATVQNFDVTSSQTMRDTSQTATSITVYDSLGAPHILTVYYSRGHFDNSATPQTNVAGPTGAAATAPNGYNSFTFNVVANPSEVTGNPTIVATGQLFFDPSGKLIEADNNTFTVDFIGAMPAQAISMNFGDGTGNASPLPNTGVAGMTGYFSNDNLEEINQDGYTSGELSNMNIDSRGLIHGYFSNGVQRLLGQVATASFIAPDAMQRVGDNLFISTYDSGQPAVGASQDAAINVGNLEQSNVNLANNFIDMMSFERGFQANTRTVQTLNQMLAELVNLGR